MAAVHDPYTEHVSFGAARTALLEAKGVEYVSDSSGGGGGGGTAAAWTLELGQGWGHPAAVRVAQYQTLLGAGLGGLRQGFLQVHLDGCWKKHR